MFAHRLFAVLLFVACCTLAAAPMSARQSAGADQYAGTWSGTYDGAGSGQFDMTLDKDKDGTMTGKVNVTTEGGNYSADLKAVVFEGPKMTAKYDFPLDPSAEVIMTATFEGSAAKGTWSLRPKGQPDELASGGIAVTKK
jgi:opacity protein-like surface antigen